MAASPSSRRLFVALWPRQDVRDAIASWQDEWYWPERASVVPRERLHMTLHFLGSVAVSRFDALHAALRNTAFQPFQLGFGRPDMWGGGIAVLRPDDTPAPLRELQARMGRALASQDFALEDRRYRAHVTLARRAYGAEPPAQSPGVAWTVDEGFVLAESLPGGKGYVVLERFG